MAKNKKQIEITKEILKDSEISIDEKNNITNLIYEKAVIASLPCLYVGKKGTYKNNVKSAFLWASQNPELYASLMKLYNEEPLAIIKNLEAEAMKLKAEAKSEWLQKFRPDTFIFKYSICLFFGIPQGTIDKIKDASGTSNKTKLKDEAPATVTDEKVTVQTEVMATA